MIKVIAFDFGGVLGPDADDWSGTYKKILTLTGLSKSRIQKIFNLHWPKLKIKKESMRDFWIYASKISNKKTDPNLLRKTYNESLYINKKFLPLINNLKMKYKVVLVANDSDDDYRMKIKKLKLQKLFYKLYCSSQVGFSKPDTKFFKFILKDLDVKSEEIIFIDNQENNVQTAKSLGINSVLYKNIRQIKKLFLPFSY